jgi:ketosteroid isomerase-like protein
MIDRRVFLSALGAGAVASAGGGEDVFALERAAMERWAKGDPDGFIELLDPEVTFCDNTLSERADGLDAVRPLYEAERGKVNCTVEFIRPKVQLAGACALVTFTLIARGADGERRYHGTEVFRRRDGRWRILHGHYSLARV